MVSPTTSGSGRSYALAWGLLSRPKLVGSRPWLGVALFHFKRAVEQHALELGMRTPSADLWKALNSRFDLDGIVEFSDAWHAWDYLSEQTPSQPPWDQELFFGVSPRADNYHEGIRNLARKQLDFVVSSCREHLRGTRLGTALDLGAGRGVQMSALRRQGLITSAVCIDTPYVVKQSCIDSAEHTWMGGDLRSIDINPIPSIDLIWVGNLLHHYSQNENQAILNRFATKLSPDGRLIVQEYVIGKLGTLGLTAAALGVHFALTTSQGRNYTEEVIGAMVEEVVPSLRFECCLDGTVSSLLCFRRQP